VKRNRVSPDALTALVGLAPHAIFILSGGIVRIVRGVHVRFRSTAYRDLDFHGMMTAGKTRVIAAAELGRAFPAAMLVPTSRVEPDFPTHAAVMAAELVRYGVPRERIVLEERSVSTVTELIELPKLAQVYGWRRIVVVTNAYHFPRIRAMVERLPQFARTDDAQFHASWPSFDGGCRTLTLVAAEEVLRLRNPRYDRLIRVAEATDAFKKRLEAEERGLRQLLEGTYTVRLA
jgi:hypothetical protein